MRSVALLALQLIQLTPKKRPQYKIREKNSLANLTTTRSKNLTTIFKNSNRSRKVPTWNLKSKFWKNILNFAPKFCFWKLAFIYVKKYTVKKYYIFYQKFYLRRWDDSQNDLIAIARKMTKVMMQMTEYTRGEGPLTTNKDVIRAAAKLSHYGTQLRERAHPVAAECTDRFLSEQLLDHVAKIDPLQVSSIFFHFFTQIFYKWFQVFSFFVDLIFLLTISSVHDSGQRFNVFHIIFRSSWSP